MTHARPARCRPTLRPRAGLAATAVLIAGLAGSGALALFGDVVEPAQAQSAASRIDQPTAATMPETAERPNGHVPAARALKPDTDVMDTGSVGGGKVNPQDHLPDSTRSAR